MCVTCNSTSVCVNESVMSDIVAMCCFVFCVSLLVGEPARERMLAGVPDPVHIGTFHASWRSARRASVPRRELAAK